MKVVLLVLRTARKNGVDYVHLSRRLAPSNLRALIQLEGVLRMAVGWLQLPAAVHHGLHLHSEDPCRHLAVGEDHADPDTAPRGDIVSESTGSLAGFAVHDVDRGALVAVQREEREVTRPLLFGVALEVKSDPGGQSGGLSRSRLCKAEGRDRCNDS
jgi:hypothetical protein